MESKIKKRNRIKSQRINLRMRINNQVRDTKEEMVSKLMKRHNIKDYDRGLMLLVRCLNDQKVKNNILSVSQNHMH